MIRKLSHLAIAFITVAASSAGAAVPPIAIDNAPHQPGRVVWADLLTDDVSRAKTFYGNVFGWTFEATEEPEYTQVLNAERPVAGIFLHVPRDPNQSEVQWLPSISVENVDGSTALARNWQGTVYVEPEDFPDRGRHAVIADPSGATVALLRANGGDPEAAPLPNDPIWADLITDDPAGMAQFYAGVVGYTVDQRVESGDDYVTLTSNGHLRAGVVSKPWRDVTSHWLIYVWVANIADTISLVEANGGQVLLSPAQTDDGNLAIISDPNGGVLAIQSRGGVQ